MAKDYTANFKEKTAATSGEEPVYLLEITHEDLAQPVRVVRDTEDLVSNGETYTAMAFEVSLPDDMRSSLPRAPIRIDNVGRELTEWIDASNGGKGAQVRLMQVMRSDPDTLECDLTLDLIGVHQDAGSIVGQLGYENFLAVAALAESYRPDNTPGIF